MDIREIGIKGELKETGHYEITFIPEELPFEQGIFVYDLDFNFPFPKREGYRPSCYCKVHLQGGNQMAVSNLATMGDTTLRLENNQTYNIQKFGQEYSINLLRNDHGRLGSLEIILPVAQDNYEQIKSEIFYMMNHVTNSLSYTYHTPVKAASFFVLYDLRVFSVVEARIPSKKVMDNLNRSVGNEEKWDIAMNNYRKSLFFDDPQSKFLFMYLACETILSMINEDVRNYKEPIIKKSLEMNAKSFFKLRRHNYHTGFSFRVSNT